MGRYVLGELFPRRCRGEGLGFFLFVSGRIGDARVQHVQEGEVKAALDAGDLGKGERGFVELAVGDMVGHDFIDEIAKSLRADFFERAGGCFTTIGQQDNGGLFELGPGTIVTVSCFANRHGFESWQWGRGFLGIVGRSRVRRSRLGRTDGLIEEITDE